MERFYPEKEFCLKCGDTKSYSSGIAMLLSAFLITVNK